MSRRLEQAAAAVLLLAAGCHFAADYDGTHFKCGDVEPRCPGAQTCVDDICVGPTTLDQLLPPEQRPKK